MATGPTKTAEIGDPEPPEERSRKRPGKGPACAVAASAESRKRDWNRAAKNSAPSGSRLLMFLALLVLCVFAVLFVVGDVLERRFLPEETTALRHLLLTLRAGIATVVASGAVYVVMRRDQKRLSDTAAQITSLLDNYRAAPSSRVRFVNPNLVHCRSLFKCDHAACPNYDVQPGERCWQLLALSAEAQDEQVPLRDFDECRACPVYRMSCPDSVTELGESFNNLMFLLEEEARQVDRMRAQMVEKQKMAATGQLAAGIAHEVGNPLSSISSIVQMLQRPNSKSDTGEQLELIQTHIKRISGTVRQLVSLARPHGESWELTDVAVPLEEAVSLVGFDRRARKVRITFDMAERLPRTYALRGQLQQVFINLILNALDAMPDGGSLTIGTRRKRGDIIITFKDTGMGIPSDTGRRVFEPFFTSKGQGDGTGLGLSVSYGIMQKHGGIIDFTSTPGEGTEFVVQLPIVDQEPDA